MAPTSDERREVAARLRKAADSDEWLDVTINNAIFNVMGEVRRPIADTLADLIDPTCHIVTVEDCDGDLTEVHDCCGDKHTRDAFTGRVLPYCPDCGARVVSGDA